MAETKIRPKSTAVVICGWCRNHFDTSVIQGKWGYGMRVCSNCGRLVQASRKESTGNLVGRKRIKLDSKDGDVV